MKYMRRMTAAALAAVLTCMSGVMAYAAVQTPDCDETLYITLDEQGEIAESSVVKRYEVREDGEICDFGTYEKVSNLTTKEAPVTGEDGSVRFPVKAADGAFYFEGTTKTTREELPWDIQVNYLLNGVKTEPQQLAGQKGLVEIQVDLVPNKKVSDFYQTNMALTLTAMVDRDSVLSLRAEGAQIQTVGNMSAVVFFALPGEECHYTIAIGSDDFEFGGLIFLMVPLTLGQLDHVADLRDAKETLEDSKDAISDSMDVLCDTLDQMRGGIAGTADGLRGLDDAREIVHSGKDEVYARADQAIEGLDQLAASLTPFQEHTSQAQNALTAIRGDVNEMVSDVNELEPKLCDLKDTVRYLRDDVEMLGEMLRSPQMDYADAAFQQLLKKTEADLASAMQNQSGLNEAVNGLAEALMRMQASGASLEEQAELLAGLELDGTDYDPEEVEDLLLALQDDIPLVDDREEDDTDTTDAADAGELQVLGGGSRLTAGAARSASAPNWSIPNELKPALGGILQSAGSMSGDSGLLQDAAGLLQLTEAVLTAIKSQEGNFQAALSESMDLFENIARISDAAEDICVDIDDLNQTLEEYHPEALQTLGDLGTMTDRAAAGVSSLSEFFGTMEQQIKSAGGPLNDGMKATLQGLADVLDQADSGLAQTDVLRGAKNTIFDTIDDKWDEFSGEHMTILDLDTDTKTVSLTSAKNPAPRSMQIVVRTKEITKEDAAEAAAVDETFHPEGNLFTRIGMIFKRIWNAICSIFQ
ncbi:MAG: hypothetical protein Q4F28_03815 [Eubacteriales bacterium]|nr:hypothetical protein [Eubacteriales bacterium]